MVGIGIRQDKHTLTHFCRKLTLDFEMHAKQVPKAFLFWPLFLPGRILELINRGFSLKAMAQVEKDFNQG